MILKPNYWAVSLSGLDCKAKLVSEIIFKYLGPTLLWSAILGVLGLAQP